MENETNSALYPLAFDVERLPEGVIREDVLEYIRESYHMDGYSYPATMGLPRGLEGWRVVIEILILVANTSNTAPDAYSKLATDFQLYRDSK